MPHSDAEISRPSVVACTTPRHTPLGLSTAILYLDDPCLYVISNPLQARGMQGSIDRKLPRRLTPSIPSTAVRYIHAADPVYQVHPPRPTCDSAEYTSAHTT